MDFNDREFRKWRRRRTVKAGMRRAESYFRTPNRSKIVPDEEIILYHKMHEQNSLSIYKWKNRIERGLDMSERGMYDAKALYTQFDA